MGFSITRHTESADTPKSQGRRKLSELKGEMSCVCLAVVTIMAAARYS